MPTRVARLKQRSQFLRVAAARNKWATPGLILQARLQTPTHDSSKDLSAKDTSKPFDKTPNLPSLEVGFTTSKKVGNAVARNRARRRLRAAVQDLFQDHAKPGIDYVLIGRRSTLDRPWEKLLQDLRTAMVKLNVWTENNGPAPVIRSGS